MGATVRCPGCGAELEIFDTDRYISCGECGCAISLVWDAEEDCEPERDEGLYSDPEAYGRQDLYEERADIYPPHEPYEACQPKGGRGPAASGRRGGRLSSVLIPLGISLLFLLVVAGFVIGALLIKNPSLLGLGSSVQDMADASPSPSSPPSQQASLGPAFIEDEGAAPALNISYLGLWKKDGDNRLVVLSQEGQTLKLRISSLSADGSTLIADTDPVTLSDGAGSFRYTDDRGISGTGSLVFLSPQQLLIQFDPMSGQGAVPADGDYFYQGPVSEDEMIPAPSPAAAPEASPSPAPAEQAQTPAAAPPQSGKNIWDYPFFNIACYPDQDRNITTYYQVGVPFEGKSYIDGSATADADQCTIWEIYSNGWVKISYETYKGLKTAYCYLSDFINLSPSGVRETSTYSDEPVYKKSTLRDVFGVVSGGDSCYVVSENGYASQIIYKLDSGTWKMGWVASDKLR